MDLFNGRVVYQSYKKIKTRVMKKILLLILLFFSTISLSQSSPFYLRAESFKAGKKNYKNEVVWDESTYLNCDILIKLDDKQVSIFSNEKQVYRVINLVHQSTTSSQWYCVDTRGNYCNIYLIFLKNQPGKLTLAIEYNDYCWFYVCKEDN
jgi:hypothetical protein